MHVDVLTVGMVYQDLILTGLTRLPRLGEERHASEAHETWGGIANMARVCSALGMDTALATAAGDDDASIRMLTEMADKGVDVSLTRRYPGWSLPLTVALSIESERAMVTVEHPLSGLLTEHLDDARFTADIIIVDLRDPVRDWQNCARSQGSLVLASRGFDVSDSWDLSGMDQLDACDVWMLNELEARSFTRLEDPMAAAKQLSKRVPLVVVTRGAAGMIAVDGATGELAEVSAFPILPRTTTGAGDSTLAAFGFASRLGGLTLRQRLDVTSFVVAGILESPGGVACPPKLADLTSAIQLSSARREAVRHLLVEALG